MVIKPNEEAYESTEEPLQLFFARGSLHLGEKIEDVIKREQFFFDVGRSKKKSNASSIRSVPISEMKGMTVVLFVGANLGSRIAISRRHGSN